MALKANPGEIKEIIEVNLPRPRSLDLMSTPEFKQLRSRVDYLVHAEEDELDPALQDLPKIPRMTQVSTENKKDIKKPKFILGFFIDWAYLSCSMSVG